jgi:hypothetical protein
MSAPVELTPASVEAVAQRVAELLATHEPARLVDAAEVARRFSLSREYVYEHATELGAVRLGDGPKARLRFDLERVADALTPRPFAPSKAPTRRRPSPTASTTQLLPVGRKR